MQVRVLYLGMLRDLAGREREVVQIPDGARLSDLYAELQQRMPKLQGFGTAIALSINYEYCDGTAVLQDNDEVALIPPVSGGTVDEDSTDEIPLPLISEHCRLVGVPIRNDAILAAIKRPEDGAVAVFDGIVRNNSRGRRTLYLDYTAYEPMALRQMEHLAQQALDQLCHPRRAHRAPPGALTDWRNQRLYCGCVRPSRPILRRVPLANRYTEEDSSHLEERVFRRWGGMGGW